MNPVQPNGPVPDIPFKQFVEIRVLGSGSFGTVSLYFYKPLGLQGLRAIKLLRIYDPDSFDQEVESLQRLQHENLVDFYGLTSSRTSRGIVLEFMEGGNLHDVIHHQTPYRYSLKDILSWCIQSAKALEYMHSLDFIHRDIKPENMLLDRTWQVLKITDFGFSKEIDNSGNTPYIGTPLYMSPEILEGKHYDKTCDVYSWTLTFWECLTSLTPFKECMNISELLRKKKIPNYLAYVSTASRKMNMLIQSGSNINRDQRISISTWRKILEVLFRSCDFREKDNQEKTNVCVWNERLTSEFFYCKEFEDDKNPWIHVDPNSIEQFLNDNNIA